MTRRVSFTYDDNGFLESVTDPGLKTTYYAYDEAGRVTGINRPDGGTLGFAYDPNGNMTVLTNPALVDHEFTYNKVNQAGVYLTPISGNYSYVYDKERRLTEIHFPSGRQITNIYTHTRLSQVQTPEGNIDFTYLCGDTIGSMNQGAESIAYGYDGSLLTSVTLSGTLNQSLDFVYNDDFQMESFTYAGATASLSYDSDGLLIDAGGYTIGRNTHNGLPETVSGGALSIGRTFNGYGEPESQSVQVGGQSVLQWTLTRDDNGRITGKTETAAGLTSHYVYAYDPVGRLLTVTRDGAVVESYGYDPDGTRISEINTLRGISGRSLGYSDEDHLLTAGSTTYQYDPDGFLSRKTQGAAVTGYTYASRGELLRVDLPDGRMVTYEHDPLGRRIAKRIDGAVVEKYLWQGLATLLAVYDASDNLLQRFEYGDGRLPVAMTQASSTYYLAYNQVDSLRVVTDAAGNVVKRIDYDAFGNILNDTNPSLNIPFGFAGGLYDRDIALVRFGYRDYNPDTGRWTAKDPIRFAGGDTDLYGYVSNNPVNGIDPLGLEPPDRSSWVPFENQLGTILDASKNTVKRYGNRIVDFIKNGSAWEAKSGKYLYLSSQIKDFLKDPDFGGKFNLVIRKGAQLSGPLMIALKENGARLWLLTKEGLVDITSSLDSMFPLIILIDPETGLPIGMPSFGPCHGGSLNS